MMNTDTITETVARLAREAFACRDSITRGSGETVTVTRDRSPQWVTDLIHAAHEDGSDGGMLPDDWRYETAYMALGFIGNGRDLTVDNDWDEASSEFADDVDIYTHDLTGWLHSRTDRYSYCDEAIADSAWLVSDGILPLIGIGQSYERREVFEAVREFLTNLADEQDSEDDDTDGPGYTTPLSFG